MYVTVFGCFVGVFLVHVMECMNTQIRPRSVLSSERVFGEWSQNPQTPGEKSPLLEAQRRVEPATLHYAGQRTQRTTD